MRKSENRYINFLYVHCWLPEKEGVDLKAEWIITSAYANNLELITLSLTFPSAYGDFDNNKPFVYTNINRIKINKSDFTVTAIKFYAWNVIWR